MAIGGQTRSGAKLAVRGRKVSDSSDTLATPQDVEEEIVERVYAAVMHQRLPPGTKLSEVALCEAFGVSRSRVRRALLVLAEKEIVELHSNRGAYVASPDPSQARSLFEARRVIEPTVAQLAATNISAEGIDFLLNHVEAEKEARARQDRHNAIRLSGEFHVALAGRIGNPVLERLVRDLIARTALMVGLFGGPGFADCALEEHVDLLDAIRSRQGEKAAHLMLHHLQHIEAQLDLSRSPGTRIDLKKALSS